MPTSNTSHAVYASLEKEKCVWPKSELVELFQWQLKKIRTVELMSPLGLTELNWLNKSPPVSEAKR